MIKKIRTVVFENGTQRAKTYADQLFNKITETVGAESSVVNVYDTRPCTQVLPVRAIPNVAVLLFADTLEEGQEILDIVSQIDFFIRQEETQAAGAQLIAEGVTAGTVDGTRVVSCMSLLPSYTPAGPDGDYNHTLNESCVSEGQPWRCCQGYNAQSNPDITPGKSPAHWVQYHTTDPARALPFVQPTGAHDTYQTNECMVLDDVTWRSTMDNNAHSPTEYPQGWERVEE